MMSTKPAQRQPVKEQLLLDQSIRIGRNRHDYIAVHVHLSDLRAMHRRDNYIRIATQVFETQINQFDGQVFILENSDIVCLARGVPSAAIDVAINRLRVLFSEDPLIAMNDAGQRSFCSWFFLERDYDLFLQHCRALHAQAQARRQEEEMVAGLVVRPEEIPLSPTHLAKLQDTIEHADLASVIRRQTICSIVAGRPLEPLFDEMYVSINDLRTITAPQLDLLSNRWLFQYLTATLDRRMLAHLLHESPQTGRPFSLNLNVATVLTSEFEKFNATIAPQLRARTVIEFNKIDMFSDIGAFLFVRDYLHELGYRICLDGLNHLTLPYYDRQRLGVDLVKLYWTPDGVDNLLPELINHARKMIMETEQARLILCRCDSERAIATGQELGIVMFQGREIDRMLAATRARKP